MYDWLDHFNRVMRLQADKLGFTLNHKHLWHAVRVNGEKAWEGGEIACSTETEVFNALKMKYVAPEDRWKHIQV